MTVWRVHCDKMKELAGSYSGLLLHLYADDSQIQGSCCPTGVLISCSPPCQHVWMKCLEWMRSNRVQVTAEHYDDRNRSHIGWTNCHLLLFVLERICYGGLFITWRLLFVDEFNKVESNPFILTTIAVSLLAGVLIIVAVILLIILLKQRAHIKRSYWLFLSV